MKPEHMTRITGGKRYSTLNATLLASDAFFDGRNWERNGRNTFLFRTPRGAYFAQFQTRRPGETDRLEPLDMDAALTLFDTLPEKALAFEDAFPGAAVVDA